MQVMRPIPEGGEVLMSYGPYYDRSHYVKAAAPSPAVAPAARAEGAAAAQGD